MNEEVEQIDTIDPRKYHTITPAKKRKILIASAIIALVVLPPIMFFYYKFAVLRPNQANREITFEIQKGQGVYTIAEELYLEKAVNSQFLFNFYVLLNRYDDNIQAGSYVIPAGTSIVELVDMFQHGRNDISITFYEGWRVEEFAEAASSAFPDVEYEKFLELAKSYEGRLFPDTYFFNQDVEEKELLDKLKTTFSKKTEEILTKENLNRVDLTEEEVLVLASLVEREVRKVEDREIVAGIIIKRWNEGVKLDIDATTQYAVGTADDWWPTNLSKADLSLEDAYNTRAVAGLPPTPICNMGISAIESVLNYKTTDYYFYLTDSEGVTHFAETLEEHEANVSAHLFN